MRTTGRCCHTCLLGLLLAAVSSHTALATGEPAPIVDFPMTGAVRSEAGAWRSKIQQVFYPSTHTLMRRYYEVWDAAPSLDLDFVWTPDRPEADRPGRISGSGHLVWRRQGLPSYDRASVVAEYRGWLRRGRPEGEGAYLERSGLLYEGEWRNGLMHGQGRLVLPSGDEYVGHFRSGKANGSGRYIDITGEIYDGPFVDGYRHGRGTTTLPSGVRYASRWIAGREAEASYAVRLAQVGAKGVPGGNDDIRIGITIDRRLPPRPKDDYRPDKGDLFYAVTNTPQGIAIRPDNKRLMSMWKGGGEIQLADGEIRHHDEILEYGVFSLVRGQLVPLTLLVEVQNRTSSNRQVVGAYLDVLRSETDTKPAIQLQVRERPALTNSTACNGSDFKSILRLENFGWSPAEKARLELSFQHPDQKGRPARLEHSRDIGTIGPRFHYNLEPQLTARGVNVPALIAAEKDGGFRCRVRDLAACKRELLATGQFGALAPKLSFKDWGTFEVKLVGNLTYEWREQMGTVRRTTSPFTLRMPLGKLPISAECGEGGERDVVAQKPLKLQLDRTGYRVPVTFRRAIPPGHVARYPLTIAIDKSSRHNFAIVVQMADGREQRSRPIDLLYYRPSWFHSDLPKPPDPPDVPSPPRYNVALVVSGGVLNLRRGPGTGHALVIEIPKGDSVGVLGCRAPDDGQSSFPWCNVHWKHYTGWASSNGLVHPETGRRPR